LRPADYARLLVLSTIWGASFLFLRLAVPEVGAIDTAFFRVLIALTVLLPVLWWKGERLDLRANIGAYLMIGGLGAGIPFLLFGYAAHHLPAGYSALLNATTPLFGALCAAVGLGEPLTRRRVLGLFSGLAGVAVLMGLGPVEITRETLQSAGACLSAALLYGITGVLLKRRKPPLAPRMVAAGSQIGAVLVLLVPAALAPLPGTVGTVAAASILGMGVLSTGVAYLIYFKLFEDVGPTKALTVTFLVPLFALIWAALLLGEPLSLRLVPGTALILIAMTLVTR
jgi:drug/metabolite transporter (DMT)-like permease